MRIQNIAPFVAALTLIAACLTTAPARAEGQAAPLQLQSASVTISGTSNIHTYTASTTTARLVEVRASAGEGDVFDAVLAPAGLEAFTIAFPAASLSSPRDGLNKNMHKALKVAVHPDITFKLSALESGTTFDSFRAVGTLTIAGVERPQTLQLFVTRTPGALLVQGDLTVMMTDFDMVPPKAMLGMLKTDPKVTVRFEAVLGSR